MRAHRRCGEPCAVDRSRAAPRISARLAAERPQPNRHCLVVIELAPCRSDLFSTACSAILRQHREHRLRN
jgi:hypothetical protein